MTEQRFVFFSIVFFFISTRHNFNPDKYLPSTDWKKDRLEVFEHSLGLERILKKSLMNSTVCTVQTFLTLQKVEIRLVALHILLV